MQNNQEDDHSGMKAYNTFDKIFSRTISREILEVSSGFTQTRHSTLDSNSMAAGASLTGGNISFSTQQRPSGTCFESMFELEMNLQVNLSVTYNNRAVTAANASVTFTDSFSLLQPTLMGISSHCLTRLYQSSQVTYNSLSVTTQVDDVLDMSIGFSRDLNYSRYVDTLQPKKIDFIYLYSNSVFVGQKSVAGITVSANLIPNSLDGGVNGLYTASDLINFISMSTLNPWSDEKLTSNTNLSRWSNLNNLTFTNVTTNTGQNGLTGSPAFISDATLLPVGSTKFSLGSISFNCRAPIWNSLLSYNSSNTFLENNVQTWSVSLNLASNITSRVFKSYISRFMDPTLGVTGGTPAGTSGMNFFDLNVDSVTTLTTPRLHYVYYTCPSFLALKPKSTYYFMQTASIVEIISQDVNVIPGASFQVEIPNQINNTIPKNIVVAVFEKRQNERSFTQMDCPCGALTALNIYVNNIISFNDLDAQHIHKAFCEDQNYAWTYKETLCRDVFSTKTPGVNVPLKISGSGGVYKIPLAKANLDWDNNTTSMLANVNISGNLTFTLSYQYGSSLAYYGDRTVRIVEGAGAAPVFSATDANTYNTAIGNKKFKVLLYLENQVKCEFSNDGNDNQNLEVITSSELEKIRKSGKNMIVNNNYSVLAGIYNMAGGSFWNDLWDGVKDVGSFVWNNKDAIAKGAETLAPYIGLGKGKAQPSKRLALKKGGGFLGEKCFSDDESEDEILLSKSDILNADF